MLNNPSYYFQHFFPTLFKITKKKIIIIIRIRDSLTYSFMFWASSCLKSSSFSPHKRWILCKTQQIKKWQNVEIRDKNKTSSTQNKTGITCEKLGMVGSFSLTTKASRSSFFSFLLVNITYNCVKKNNFSASKICYIFSWERSTQWKMR